MALRINLNTLFPSSEDCEHAAEDQSAKHANILYHDKIEMRLCAATQSFAFRSFWDHCSTGKRQRR